MSYPLDRRAFLRGAVGSLGLYTLAGCGGGGGSGSGSGGGDDTAGYVIEEPSQFAQQLLPAPASVIASIKSQPLNFLGAYAALNGTAAPNAFVQAKLGSAFAGLSDAGCMAAYASLVAFSCAQVGTTSLAPLPSTMNELLGTPAMACGHFCKLTTLLTLLGHPEVIPPDGAAGSPTLHFIVWLQNVPLDTGIHSQLILTNVLANAYLLLDPTYGYALRIPYSAAGPSTSLTAIENAATMLRTPIAAQNLAILDPAGTANWPTMTQTLLNGALGPQYIYHDGIYGSEGWDTQISQIFDSMS
jgi:hypothetical protein